jgi:hypothetical protein
MKIANNTSAFLPMLSVFHTSWFVESLWSQTLVIDPHPENPLHSQPRLMAARFAHHARHCHGDNHSLYLTCKVALYAPPAACLLPMVSRHDLHIYAADHADEEYFVLYYMKLILYIWSWTQYTRK